MATQLYPLKPNQPHDVLGEVVYEIKMLLAQTATQPPDDTSTQFVLLESRLLHTRNLIDFFEKQKRSTRWVHNNQTENDDVLAQDYGFSPREVTISQRDKERLNKALAHITYERVEYRSPDQRRWPLKTTLLPILVPCEEFLQHLIDNFLEPADARIDELTSLRDYIRAVMEEIKKLPDDS